MARGQAGQADKQLGLSRGAAAISGTNAGNIYSSLEPQLESMATNPQGYSSGDLAAMNTASQQSLGGSTAGITGQGMLTAARTRNSAGIPEALDQAARTAGETQSQNALGIQENNANLKQKQQESALSALGGLYGENLGNQTSLLGQGAGDLQGRAAGGGWAQGFSSVLGALTGGHGFSNK